MRAVHLFPATLLSVLVLVSCSGALRCYTCMSSNNHDCNRQGWKSCLSYSDACIVVVGHNSSVMKSCSYRSLCSQAPSQPGVRVHCCYSDDCNARGHAPTPPGLSFLLLGLVLGLDLLL